MAYDSEYDGRMVAATRNIEAIFVALNHFESKRAADAQRVEDLMMTVTQLTQQVNSLNQKVALLQAQLYQAGIR
jgi:predicted extracellular nuclease